ncbi:hypothetical protein C8J31_101794 [Rhizobium sp. PP-CC-2G-626]|nr:hypothetical protein C8J31_101794 [Rhizobium sp. PP-CC-2G-626]
MTGTDIRISRNVLFIKPAKRHLYNGQWLTALELSELTGIPRSTIYKRLRRGQPLDQVGKSGHVPKRYLFRGQMMTAPEVAELTGLDRSTVYDRISDNIIMEAHEIPSAYQVLEDWGNRVRILTYRGKSNSIAGWASDTGISQRTIASRLNAGWTLKDALTRTVDKRRASKTFMRNRRLVSTIVSRFRSVRNRLLIHRIASAFHSHTGGYDQTSPHTLGTGLGRHAVERGQNENPFPTENRRASA